MLEKAHCELVQEGICSEWFMFEDFKERRDGVNAVLMLLLLVGGFFWFVFGVDVLGPVFSFIWNHLLLCFIVFVVVGTIIGVKASDDE